MAASIYPLWAAMAIHHAARHYTLARKLDKAVGRSKSDKGKRSRSLQANSSGAQERGASEKQILGMKISKV
jgi:hypothetical protein